MKKILLFVNILICSSVFAQIDYENNAVQVKPNWELKKIYNYNFSDRNISINVNDTVMNVVNNSKKTVQVLDKNNFAYKLELINGKNTSNDPDDFYRDFINNSDGIKYQFTTNLSGEFLELLNINDIRKSFLKVTDELYDKKRKVKGYKENIVSLESMINSETYIPYVFEQEIQVLNFFNGYYLKLGEEYIGKTLQDNIFGFPISSSTTTFLQEIDKKDETFTIVSDQNLSKDDFEKLWEEMAYYMLNDKNLQLTQDQIKKEIKKYSETIELKVGYVSKYDKNAILLESDYKFIMNIGSKKTINHLNIKRDK
ncbi:hypothetical protein [Faecalibacter rhinopitheci]|uniref:DUF3298 domain-containing protein n=1 Tax=Faecalibacter rhinopitheci TaxID=2779678 RepID=A0A8J7FT04_9FLAO|nr:hypothetical protein [Faecalibacter rhinopitheci]MBF0597162.1 hypothetical protein [Faecalibacter rhinopitheci]